VGAGVVIPAAGFLPRADVLCAVQVDLYAMRGRLAGWGKLERTGSVSAGLDTGRIVTESA
jgi:hypothetical protein